MLIERLDVYRVDMPLIYPWRTAYGEDYSIQSVLIKASSGDHAAWAEVSPLTAPTYLTEGAGAVFYNISEIFGPQVVGHEYDTPEEINERLAVFKGNTFAKGRTGAVLVGPQGRRDRHSPAPSHRRGDAGSRGRSRLRHSGLYRHAAGQHPAGRRRPASLV